MKYRYDVPATPKMFAITVTGEDSDDKTAYQDALWHYNVARRRNGVVRSVSLPAGTVKTLARDA
jgi:hypothetical protein